jgi:hypothetical protein
MSAQCCVKRGERWRIPLATMISDQAGERSAAAFAPLPSGIFTILATRNDQRIVTHRIIPDVAVAQARVLGAAGWQVRISGAGGRQYAPTEFHQLLSSEFV